MYQKDHKLKVNSLKIIYFSATGTTKKIVEAICSSLNDMQLHYLNITNPEKRKTALVPVKEDLLILALPVYEERIPIFLRDYLLSIKGYGQPAVVVGVYGNVGYGIILQEMQELLNQKGFITIAGGAFVGEHSFSHKQLPIAIGRPNVSDLLKAKQFGLELKNKLETNHDNGKTYEQKLPGTLPFMARVLPQNSSSFFADIPQLNKIVCNQCGVCVKKCPLSAIDPLTFQSDTKSCTRCFACVRDCPRDARSIKLKIKPIVKIFFKKHKNKQNQPVWVFI